MATEIQTTTQKMSGKQIYWKLLKELECPVCLQYMASPIKMCQNGHNICGSCIERLAECPTCRGKFLNVRNIVLEYMAATAVYPCENREAGCEETFTVDERNNHLSVCVYRSTKYSVGMMSDDHVRTESNNVFAEVPGLFNVNLWHFFREIIILTLFVIVIIILIIITIIKVKEVQPWN